MQNCEVEGLVLMVHEILRGGLKHGFFPSPPEMRMCYDRVMKPVIEARDQEYRRLKFMQERRDMELAGQKSSPQERERVAEKMRQLAAQLQREAEANPNSRHYVPDGKTAAVEKYDLPYDAPGQIHITGALAAYFERKPAK